MLRSLSIQNIVLIEKAEIQFDQNNKNGLYIFTGETGSGKSLLLNAIGLIIGKKTSSRYISDESKSATICAKFDISDNQPCKEILSENDLLDEEDNNSLSIRRIIHKTSSGNKSYINDQLVTNALHNKIGQTLVEIHGQFETSNLLNESNHLNILDQYAKNDSLISNLRGIYGKIKENNQKLVEFEEKKEKYLREKDYILYVIEELTNANIQENEEQDLISKKNSLKNKDSLSAFLKNLKQSLSQANENIYNSQNLIIRNQNLISDGLENESENISKLSEDLDQFSMKIDAQISTVNEIARDLQNDNLDISQIEERLFEIKNLSRKFNSPSDQLNNIKEESQAKLETLENEDKFINEVKKNLDKLTKEYDEICEVLYKKRSDFAKKLANNVENELKFLKMESVKFKIEVIHNKDQIQENGKDKVKFLTSINNNKFDLMTRIASGGELSRFMLALKISIMDTKSTPSLIFDEIDTGIGGKTSHAVGDRLAKLAKSFQILLVTHQPQIAAKSDTHFCIKKEENNNKVKTTIEKLDKNCQYIEVARMISGENITEESLAAAKNLFN